MQRATGGPGIRNDSAQESFGVYEARLDAPLLDGNGDADPARLLPLDLVAAVIDTGIDPGHRDLDGGKVLGFKDFVNGGADPLRRRGSRHPRGGHDRRRRAAATRATAGVAPGAGLVGVKVLDDDGDGSTSDVVAGIEWVGRRTGTSTASRRSTSRSASEGCGDGFGADSQAVNQAHDAGLVVVVAAGNEGPGTCTIGSPGDAKDALTVGAMADLGAHGFKQADFSSRGPTADGRIKPDVSAPGVGITSALAGTTGGYPTLNGTSMAAPFVDRRRAADARRQRRAARTTQVKAAIKRTAIDWGRGGDNADAGTHRSRTSTTAPAASTPTRRWPAPARCSTARRPRCPRHALREGTPGRHRRRPRLRPSTWPTPRCPWRPR